MLLVCHGGWYLRLQLPAEGLTSLLMGPHSHFKRDNCIEVKTSLQ